MPPKAIKKHHTPATLSDDDLGYVRLPVILELFPIGESSWHRGVQAGLYPKPVKLSERVSAWKISDIRKLLAARAADEQP
jgi:predicted DNA-binding transcriptional regulator AlpA